MTQSKSVKKCLDPNFHRRTHLRKRRALYRAKILWRSIHRLRAPFVITDGTYGNASELQFSFLLAIEQFGIEKGRKETMSSGGGHNRNSGGRGRGGPRNSTQQSSNTHKTSKCLCALERILIEYGAAKSVLFS